MENAVQLNVRLDRTVKERGEAQLKAIGLTPTDFLRLVWEQIAKGGEDLARVDAAVRPDGAQARQDERKRRLAAFETGQGLYAHGLVQLGISGTVPMDDVSDQDALAQELEERTGRQA